jgi:capsid protein
MDAKRSPTEAAKSLKQRRAETAERARKNRDTLERAISLRQHRSILAALEKIMIRGREFVLDTWANLLQPHVWALDASGHVVGHVLTISDDAFHGAADWLVAPLAEALDEIWSDPLERRAWRGSFVDALRRLANQSEAVEQAWEDRDALRAVGGVDSDEPGPPRKM